MRWQVFKPIEEDPRQQLGLLIPKERTPEKQKPPSLNI